MGKKRPNLVTLHRTINHLIAVSQKKKKNKKNPKNLFSSDAEILTQGTFGS
jgi:hypothetical protein